MATKKKEPTATEDYVATRTETFVRGENTYAFVAGVVYSDLPEDLVEELSGNYGALVMVEPGTLEVQTDDGEWVVAPEEEAANG